MDGAVLRILTCFLFRCDDIAIPSSWCGGLCYSEYGLTDEIDRGYFDSGIFDTGSPYHLLGIRAGVPQPFAGEGNLEWRDVRNKF